MKLFASLAVFQAAALALSVQPRDDAETITDEYLFDITLDEFIVYRDAENPDTLDWTSDGCTDSPDNPLGFDFEPACYRHDFGYTNYREQDRFTKAAKAEIDSNFLSDLDYQCDSETFKSICKALAKVYYAAVKLLGGQDATKRTSDNDEDVDWQAEYDNSLAVYNQLVAEAEAAGLLPSTSNSTSSSASNSTISSTRKEKRQAVEDISQHWSKLDVYG